MNLLSLNIDEIIYRVHLVVWNYFLEPLWYVVSLKWIFGSSSAKLYENANQLGVVQEAGFFDKFFGSGLFRIFSSRPSIERNSIEETLNPTSDRGNFEFFTDILFGRGDKESIFELLFTTPFGWMLLLAITAFLFWLFFQYKLSFLTKKERVIYDIAHHKKEKKESNDKATRWQNILTAVNSDQENSWKIALMDADIMLEEVLAEQGFHGRGVGDALKSVTPEYQDVVQYAWEGHKVRNNIAHQADYVLSQREARMAISMYERFFSAFYQT